MEATPTERLTSDLQDILEDVNEKQEYQKAIEKCTFLLSDSPSKPQSKKTAKFRSPLALLQQEASGNDDLLSKLEMITSALYDIQAKCYLNMESHQALVDWVHNTVPVERREPLQPSVWYAKYRLGDYAGVLKHFHSNANDLESHLRAQSLFHSADTKAALDAYRTMLPEEGADPDLRIEVLVNAMATLSANATPQVDVMPSATEEWTGLARSMLDDDSSSDLAFDLAYNVGTLHRIIGPGGGSDSADAFFDLADRLCRESSFEDPNDSARIRTNRIWSRQWRGLETDASEYDTKDVPAAPRIIASINRALTSSALTVPTANIDKTRWTALQHRLYRYALAASLLAAGDAEGCRRSCQALQASLGITGSAASSGDASKKKKKKTKASATSDMPQLPTAAPEAGDLAWWESRIDVLLAHAMLLPSMSEEDGEEKTEEPGDVDGAKKLLKSRLSDLKNQESAGSVAYDHAIAHVQLHLFYLEHNLDGSPTAKQQIEVLESLPKSFQSRKGVVATLTSLKASLTSEKSSSATDSGDSSAFLADVLFSQGEYQQAADMYQEKLPAVGPSNKPEELQQHARFVQALMHVDPVKANEHWMEIQNALGISSESLDGGSDSIDADKLEATALPRRNATKSALVAAAETSTETEKPRRSAESVLRQRARRREAHIAKLEAQGKYNADRPTKPDPERWLPKYARSSNRRRRNNNSNHKGAQGGVSDKDALKLDAYARKQLGGTAGNSGPSTANLKVSGGGRKGGGRRK